METFDYSKLVTEGTRGKFHNLMHSMLEKAPLIENAVILEPGFGGGEHLKFVPKKYSKYIGVDLSDNNLVKKEEFPNFEFRIGNVEKLQFPNESFDRVVVTCLFHHLENPQIALQEIRRVTRPGGIISILLPCDPGWAYRSARKLTSDRFLSNKYNINVKLLRAVEHRNHYASLNSMISENFKADKIIKTNFPFRVQLWNLNFFTIYQIRILG